MTRQELNQLREDLFCRFCNKSCKNLNSLNQHQTRCKCNPDRKDYNKLGEYSHINFKDQTKYTNSVIARASTSLQEAYDSGRFICAAKGKPGAFTGKHHTEATRKLLSETGKYNAKNHLNGWKAGSSKKQNKYELYTTDFLRRHNINFETEVVVSTHRKGATGTPAYYQLDFIVCGKVDLELDGSGHDCTNDSTRDKFISPLYDVYRIRHNDSMEDLETQLEKFIDYLHSCRYL